MLFYIRNKENKEVLFMSSIVMNKVITEKKDRTESVSLFQRIGRYIAETSEVMAPGVFAMNNTYFRPVK